MMGLYYSWLPPLILLLIGLALYLTNGNAKRERIGWVLTLIALVVLALVFLGRHWHHLLGRWSP